RRIHRHRRRVRTPRNGRDPDGTRAVGEIIPPQSVGQDTQRALVSLAERLCEQLRRLGYRGNICADAIVSPAGEVVFTESNRRLTASTHLHRNIVARVVGPERRNERVFLERGGSLSVSSYES